MFTKIVKLFRALQMQFGGKALVPSAQPPHQLTNLLPTIPFPGSGNCYSILSFYDIGFFRPHK